MSDSEGNINKFKDNKISKFKNKNGDQKKSKNDKETKSKMNFGEDEKDIKRNISEIKNKAVRSLAYRKLLKEKAKASKDKKKEREKLIKKYGAEAVVKQIPKTIENCRVYDETKVTESDEELADEFDEEIDQSTSETQNVQQGPKVLITTSDRPSGRTNKFCKELKKSIPNSVIKYRRALDLKKITVQAADRGYTGIIVVNEDKQIPNGLLISKLPEGPTASFKLTNVRLTTEIKNHGTMTDDIPELIFNRFETTVGRSIANLFSSLYPKNPDYSKRRIMTFHNQRDYIFVRQHRYQFKMKNDAPKAGIQELGPRFTLKLRSLQKGTFDSKHGEYEFIQQKEKIRRKFTL